ncbi:transposase, partial [Roseateles oligotrophus]
MKQASFDMNLSVKRTRKSEFLGQMELVVPWQALVDLIAPFYPEGRTGRPPFSLEAMLRTHFMQQWFTLSDLAMEEAFFDTPIYREFAKLDAWGRLPDESTILRFRHRLEKHKLAEQVLGVVNEMLVA